MEDVIVPLGFFAIIFGFPLLKRELAHRHRMEQLREERAAQAALPAPEARGGDDAPALALRLPEPLRLYALALLCRLEDAPQASPDPRAEYVLTQARTQELPATLRAYLNLTPAARQRLAAAGQTPEALLGEQLELISRGVDEALGRGAAAASAPCTTTAISPRTWLFCAHSVRPASVSRRTSSCSLVNSRHTTACRSAPRASRRASSIAARRCGDS